MERDRGLADLDTVPCRDTSRYAFPGAVQEANMFSTFAQQAATREAVTDSSGRCVAG